MNSRGASACSAITPITWPDLRRSGAAQKDWYFSSSASGTILIRGSASALSVMNSGWSCSATQPARPSPRSNRSRPARSPYGSDTARSTSEPSSGSTKYTKQAWQSIASLTRSTIARSTRSRSSEELTVLMIWYR